MTALDKQDNLRNQVERQWAKQNQRQIPHGPHWEAFGQFKLELKTLLLFKKFVKIILGDDKMWGEDLTAIEGYEALVLNYLTQIEEKGMLEALKQVVEVK